MHELIGVSDAGDYLLRSNSLIEMSREESNTSHRAIRFWLTV